jgi:hypothetical protein
MQREGLIPAVEIPRYALPSLLGKAEPEEAAARLLIACQEAGSWGAISAQAVFDTAWAEYEMDRAWQRHRAELQKWEVLHQKFLLRNFWTLGLYARLVSEPPKPVPPPDTGTTPFSGVFLWGHRFLLEGFQALLDTGLVVYNKADGTLAPTGELLRLVAEKFPAKGR